MSTRHFHEVPQTVAVSTSSATKHSSAEDDSLESSPLQSPPRRPVTAPDLYGSTTTTTSSTSRRLRSFERSRKARWRVWIVQGSALILSTTFLAIVVVWALVDTWTRALWRFVSQKKRPRKRERRLWDTDLSRLKFSSEPVVRDMQYYARACGFDFVEQDVVTEDGYILKVFKVVCDKAKRQDDAPGQQQGGDLQRGGWPVLIQHGLFQSAGSFITSEERSLAFWLAEHGDYQVYLGNGRGVFDAGHIVLKRSDPRFWDFNIKDLALHDLPALVDHVRRDSGHEKVAFIGHSQGNATMFSSLSKDLVPELGEHLSVFIALAPAVYAGPLTTGFPFSILKSMSWSTWRHVFGELDFIPVMTIAYNHAPSALFASLGYIMFAWLFDWTDRNWLLRRKKKMFRFMPSPVSSASMWRWTGAGGFSTTGCILDPAAPKWFDERFPPLSIYYGGADRLVLTEPLLHRLSTVEKDVKVIRVSKIEDGEHCDTFWHQDAVEICFHDILDDIERTRTHDDGRNTRGLLGKHAITETLVEV